MPGPRSWIALLRDAERGEDMIEFVLVALLVAVASATILVVLGDNLSTGYTSVEECVSMAAGNGRGPPSETPDGGRGPPRCRL